MADLKVTITEALKLQGNNQGQNSVQFSISSYNSVTPNVSFVGYMDANDTIQSTVYTSADSDYQYGEGGNYNDTSMIIYKVG